MAEVFWCGSCGWSGPWGWPAELGSAQEAPALGRRRGWQGADARRRWLGLALNRCGRLARPRALLPRALLLHWAPLIWGGRRHPGAAGSLQAPRPLLPWALLMGRSGSRGPRRAGRLWLSSRASRGVEAVVAHALGCLAVDTLVGVVAPTPLHRRASRHQPLPRSSSRTPGQCLLL